PISMIGMGATPAALLPAGQLAEVYSEPPYATVGLGTGTMASYSRWLQHMTYYEIDEKIREMNRPVKSNREPFFLYVKEAGERGAFIEILMGDARQTLMKEDRHDLTFPAPYPTSKREHYYKFLNLDAFSSDAIPVHLLTKEAVELYMSKLT